MLKTQNTASFVDDRYAKLLAKQIQVALSDDAITPDVLALAAMRRGPLFLREQAGVRIGPGFATGTRVWQLDRLKNAPGAPFQGLVIATADFDRRGKVRVASLKKAPTVHVTQHALARAFERLSRSGTNAFADVVRHVLVPLSHLERPSLEDLNADFEVELGQGIGHLRCVVQLRHTSADPAPLPCWVAVTFIPPAAAR